MLIQKEENTTKEKVKINNYYYRFSSKTNADIIGITLSMRENITLKPSLLLIMYLAFKIPLERDLGI